MYRKAKRTVVASWNLPMVFPYKAQVKFYELFTESSVP